MSSQPAAAPEENEPSMEEILASIRKIIADDSLGTKREDALPKKPKPAAPPPEPQAVDVQVPVASENVAPPEPVAVDVMIATAEPDDDADVLDLASVATVAQAGHDVLAPQARDVEVPFVDTPAPGFAMPTPVDVLAPRVTSVSTLEDRIMSDNTSSLVGQAFAQLSRNTPMPAVGRSLEDVVVELLRPMLRGWIDEHLPTIVEKLVKAEIERVARGG